MSVSVPTKEPRQFQAAPLILAGLVIVLLLLATQNYAQQKQVLAVLIGVLAGFSLYHASFGFTAAWRRVVAEGRGMGLRYQFLLIISVSAISFPLIAGIDVPEGWWGESTRLKAGGFVAPVGVGMIFGAFIFGYGMQFGGGCGSGTLFVAGGGSTRMCITLAAFVAGSFLGTIHFSFWSGLPRFAPWSMVRNMGPFWAFVALCVALGLIALFTIWREKRLYGALEEPRRTSSLIHGPWSPLAGVVGLFLVCVLTFLIVGRPWGVTWGFALWGAKIVSAFGVDLNAIPYWTGGRGNAVEASVLRDTTSVMNFGIMAGALCAAALAARFKPIWSLTRVEISTAIVGGLLMGYGARLAYGCNIGAYLGGLVSGSLHGWAWMIAAFVGSGLAIYTKRRLGIS